MFAEVCKLPGNDWEVTLLVTLTLCVIAERTLLCFRFRPNPLSAQLSAGSMEKP
jgi:hypothetical protein